MTQTWSPFEGTILETLKADLAAQGGVLRHPNLETLLDYVAGSLPSRERALLDAHACRCGECREQLRQLDLAAEKALEKLRGCTASWSFASWVAARKPLAERVRRLAWRPARVAWALGAAAAAACLITGFVRLSQPSARWIARDESLSMRWDLVALFASAGAMLLVLTVTVIFRRRR